MDMILTRMEIVPPLLLDVLEGFLKYELKEVLRTRRVLEVEQFEKIWVIFCTKTSDMPPVMAQRFMTGRPSFTSSNGYESPPLNSAVVSNGDDYYDSDGSNFASH
ncbi:hypothetical protein ACSBR1_036617 [Camellia fascicularis]